MFHVDDHAGGSTSVRLALSTTNVLAKSTAPATIKPNEQRQTHATIALSHRRTGTDGDVVPEADAQRDVHVLHQCAYPMRDSFAGSGATRFGGPSIAKGTT